MTTEQQEFLAATYQPGRKKRVMAECTLKIGQCKRQIKKLQEDLQSCASAARKQLIAENINQLNEDLTQATQKLGWAKSLKD